MARSDTFLSGGVTGGGVLGAIGSWVYWLLVLEMWIVLTCLPTVAIVVLFGVGATTIPVLVLSLVFVGPPIAAALFAWRQRRLDDDMAPTRHFWRGYKLNWRDVLVWWAPLVVIAALLSITLTNGDLYDGPRWMLAFSWAVLGLLALLSCPLLLLSAIFSFRLRDRFRLAAFVTVVRPLTTLGWIAIAVLAAAAALFLGDLWVLILASAFTLLASLNSMPVEALVMNRFVASDEETEVSEDDDETGDVAKDAPTHQ
ncbi:MAG: DUF624 domain-containing protein [Propionibacteriaceae bacterium]|jgi:uncharacterized membrane protein YesL|nr:DUF624 domain-containing protein [Propionibacteriaceae bacterium]